MLRSVWMWKRSIWGTILHMQRFVLFNFFFPSHIYMYKYCSADLMIFDMSYDMTRIADSMNHEAWITFVHWLWWCMHWCSGLDARVEIQWAKPTHCKHCCWCNDLFMHAMMNDKHTHVSLTPPTATNALFESICASTSVVLFGHGLSNRMDSFFH